MVKRNGLLLGVEGWFGWSKLVNVTPDDDNDYEEEVKPDQRGC